MSRNHDIADALGLLERKKLQGDTQAAALLTYIADLEKRILNMHVIIDELRAELKEAQQMVQAYKNMTEMTR